MLFVTPLFFAVLVFCGCPWPWLSVWQSPFTIPVNLPRPSSTSATTSASTSAATYTSATLTSAPIHFRLDVDLVRAQAWWSPTGAAGSWSSMWGGGRNTEEGYGYTTTRLGW